MTANREPALLAYSACRLCTHSAEQGLVLVCTKPALLAFDGSPEPVAVMRAAGADCGPAASHIRTAYQAGQEA